MKKTIDVQVGIWDSEYTLTEHRNKTITILVPFVKWHNNTGILAKEKIRVTDPAKVKNIKQYFKDNKLVDKDGILLEDHIY